MKNYDLLLMSWQSLKRRKVRTILTIIGVIIGTCSIVVMLSLGIAMDQNFKEQIASMGDLTIINVNAEHYGPEPNPANKNRPKLDDNAVATFSKIEGVKAVMPQKRAYYRIAAGKMVSDVQVIGVNPETLKEFDFKIDKGRLLTPTDKEALIFGSYVSQSFFNPRLKNPHMYGPVNVNLLSSKLLLTADFGYGQRQRSNDDPDFKPPPVHEVKGVGILKESNDEKAYCAYINIAYLEKILAEDERQSLQNRERKNIRQNQNKYDVIKVKCHDFRDVQKVQEQIKAMGYQTYSLTEMIESMKKASRVMQLILGGIGAISLLVAALGITNTMIMSIYERTREIGVIKVLGAELNDIKKMFLLEAGMIGFIGGIIGVLLSYIISFVLNKIGAGMMEGMGSSKLSVIPVYLAFGAIAFATLVGLISGYSPARRAMNLSVLEAIRTE
ncbi:ABC transporter permease [Thermosyntropha sp.]|uniref:ABC transporter permease n=1 Tax=Thermosyntropha sp. TaxID=2740820 RepID=UPI0025F72CF9|nr:ABC transporter permease [Thermosyntropha sp.]MBO8158997.1 ABC transporter permease [Thermosyntropha sp.]